MAIYKIFPEKDASLYSLTPSANAGRDEILELASYTYQNDRYYVRTLIQFPSDEIQTVVDTYIGSDSFAADLKLYLAEANELPLGYTVYAAPVSESWTNGVGKYGDVPTDTSGASWYYSDAGSTNWTVSTMSLAPGATASYESGLQGGGNWFTGSLGYSLLTSQSHGLTSTHDLTLNVTNAVKLHYSSSKGLGGISNNGFILKLPESIEYYGTGSVWLRYYGGETHTIFPPTLDIKWDDSSYDSSSLSLLSTSNATFSLLNNRGEYADLGKYRFRIKARPKYPTRTYTTSSVYNTNYRLPSASYWGLRDENTEEMVINFDQNYTKISADSTSAYFDVYMGGLQPERYYRILIKSTIDGSEFILDDRNIFKVTRNG